MHNEHIRADARSRLAAGATLSEVSRARGVSRAAIRQWRDRSPGTTPHRSIEDCPRCTLTTPLVGPAYSHLLGCYLGDGCLSALPRGVFALRVSCDAKYPRVISDVQASIRQVRPASAVFEVWAPGCVVIQALWKHWVCLFPQHGPGRKHERPIVLEPWQQRTVDEHPKSLLRGLFHSDGCRSLNWTVRQLRDGPKRYEYSRYLFSNESDDIIGICAAALDALGIHWTRPRRNLLSVARRADVALLDEFVGPKS